MSTATPTRETVSSGLRALLRSLGAAGWQIEAPGVEAPADASYCFLGRSAGRSGQRPVTHLFYVFDGPREITIDTLWRLASDTRLAGADHAVLCLGPDVVLPADARDTAACIQVRVLRLRQS